MLRAALAALVCCVLALAPNPSMAQTSLQTLLQPQKDEVLKPCLLYTSDAADE